MVQHPEANWFSICHIQLTFMFMLAPPNTCHESGHTHIICILHFRCMATEQRCSTVVPRRPKYQEICCVCCRSRAKLVWILSFVLAPYTYILSQATHKTEARRFIEGVMPRLLEQSLAPTSTPDPLPGRALGGHALQHPTVLISRAMRLL